MGDRHLLADRLSCPCTVCITWRRLGLELSRGHQHQGYLGAALSRLRLTFNDLLDYRSVHQVEESPVAEGGTPVRPPVAPDLVPVGERPAGDGGEGAHREGQPKRSRSRHRRSPSKKRKDKKAKKKSEVAKREPSEKSEHRSKKSEKRSEQEKPTSPKEEKSEGESSERGGRARGHRDITPERRETRSRRRSPSRRRGSPSPRAAEPEKGAEEEEESDDPQEAEAEERRYSSSRVRRRKKGSPRRSSRMRRRPAAAPQPRRRPAARAPEAGAENMEEEYKAGHQVAAVQVPPGVYQRGDWILIDEGVYFKQVIQAAGRVTREQIDSGERELHLELTGTKNEDLLKFATGQGQGLCRVHLCRDSCDQAWENPDLVHCRRLRKLPEGGEKSWEINLLQERETGLLRADHERWQKEEEDKRKRGHSSSTSKDKKAKKKKKKRKKEDKAPVGEKESPERKKARVGSKAHAQKTLEACFGNTGLDPNQRVRLKVARHAKRALRKSRDTSSSTSSGSSSHASSGDEMTLLEDRSKIHRLADRAPGVLTASSIKTMATYLTQVTSTGWDQGTGKVPPLLSLYARVYVSNKLTGGLLREFMTLSHASDLLLQGRISEGLDTMIQRLKSLEMVGNGANWQLAQKIELIPALEAGMTTRQEHQVARRENRLDQQVKGQPSFSTDKGKGKTKGKTSEKGKDKGKNKNKEGEPKKP
eukprot:s373_g10.t1